MLTLFGDLESGNVHKVQMILRRRGIPYARVDVSQRRGETRRPEFLAINPIGKVPALALEGGDVLSESGAILYLFATSTELWPSDERRRAEVLRWMFFEQYSHEPALTVLRYLRHFVDHPEHHAHRIADLEVASRRALATLEARLKGRRWIAADGPTIADYALYPYTRWADEAGVDLSGYSAISQWLARVEELPGFLPLRVDGAARTSSFEAHFR